LVFLQVLDALKTDAGVVWSQLEGINGCTDLSTASSVGCLFGAISAAVDTAKSVAEQLGEKQRAAELDTLSKWFLAFTATELVFDMSQVLNLSDHVPTDVALDNVPFPTTAPPGVPASGPEGTIVDDSSAAGYVLFRIIAGSAEPLTYLVDPDLTPADPNAAFEVVQHVPFVDNYQCLAERLPLRDWLPLSDLTNYATQESATPAPCLSTLPVRIARLQELDPSPVRRQLLVLGLELRPPPDTRWRHVHLPGTEVLRPRLPDRCRDCAVPDFHTGDMPLISRLHGGHRDDHQEMLTRAGCARRGSGF
jgi:hypothetical protein